MLELYSLLVLWKGFIPKRNNSTQLQKKVLLEIHHFKHTAKSLSMWRFYKHTVYDKMTNIQYINEINFSFFVKSRYLFLKWWKSRFGMNNTLFLFWECTDLYSSPLCLCLFTLTSTPIKDSVFVDWISVSVFKCRSQLNKAYSQLQQQIHQP